MTSTLPHYSKFIVAIVGAVATAVSEGLVPEDWNSYLTVAIVFLTALGVYQVPNEEKPMETTEEDFDEFDL